MSNNPFAERPQDFANPPFPSGPTMIAPGDPGIYREGSRLVVSKQAQFPPICLVTNQPTDRWLVRKMTWHHPAVYLAILPGFLIYIILALVLQKKATLRLPLAKGVIRRRRIWIAIGWLIVLVSAIVVSAGCLAPWSMQDYAPLIAIAGFVGFFVGGLVGLLGSRTVWPVEIDDHFVWLKGVAPDYLSALPDFRGPRF